MARFLTALPNLLFYLIRSKFSRKSKLNEYDGVLFIFLQSAELSFVHQGIFEQLRNLGFFPLYIIFAVIVLPYSYYSLPSLKNI